MYYLVDRETKEHIRVPEDRLWMLVENRRYHALVKADADGWIEWNGGECPLNKGDIVDVKHRDGEVFREPCGELYSSNWKKFNRMPSSDIVAYRAVLNAEETKMKQEWDGEGLPPVGKVCEVMHCEKWRECEIIAHFKQPDGMVAAYTVEYQHGVKTVDARIASEFRPICTDRDRWIEAAMKVHGCTTDSGGLHRVALAIYDAGLAKLPEQKQ